MPLWEASGPGKSRSAKIPFLFTEAGIRPAFPLEKFPMSEEKAKTPAAPTAADPLKKALSLVGAAGLITFPIWTYFGLPVTEISSIAIALIVAAFLRILWKPTPLTAFITMFSAVIGIAAAVLQSVQVLKMWPLGLCVLVLLALAAGFGKDDGMVTRAVAGKNEVDAPIRAYSRALSIVWICLFFMIGAVAALTCFWGNMKSWVFWNGAMAWVLVFLFWGTERVARAFILKDLRRQAAAKGTPANK